ncbi:hypothetical protein PF006_g28890 [Phytophthora fragariae]|nr:hypothetical protein PF006_g28890 [Phytophthora fragariae]
MNKMGANDTAEEINTAGATDTTEELDTAGATSILEANDTGGEGPGEGEGRSEGERRDSGEQHGRVNGSTVVSSTAEATVDERRACARRKLATFFGLSASVACLST